MTCFKIICLKCHIWWSLPYISHNFLMLLSWPPYLVSIHKINIEKRILIFWCLIPFSTIFYLYQSILRKQQNQYIRICYYSNQRTTSNNKKQHKMSTLNICYIYDLTNACTEYTAENKVSGVCFSETRNDIHISIMGTGDGSKWHIKYIGYQIWRSAQKH
jgi:hypothetical protein